ncbi:MAG: hypothetical protein ACI945_000678 [Pseudohongiellaceae bacterium]
MWDYLDHCKARDTLIDGEGIIGTECSCHKHLSFFATLQGTPADRNYADRQLQ